jgi:diguanylate cyclase (GGDEF)-like protein
MVSCGERAVVKPAVQTILVVTLTAVLCSILITLALTFIGFWLSGIESVSRQTFIFIAIGISAFVPAVCAPWMVRGIIATQRRLAIANEELARLASLDQLTSLANRRGFDEAAGAAVAAAQSSGSPLAVLMCDIDHFKSINDRFGHDFGDATLVQIAAHIHEVVQDMAHVAGRQGGEEFAIVLPGRNLEEACAVAERLRLACALRPIFALDRVAPVTISIGVAAGAGESLCLRELMASADAALYEVKARGRNHVLAAGHSVPGRPALASDHA